MRGREKGGEWRRSKQEYSTRRGLFAILCIRDAHFYAFTFTGWKATSYCVEAEETGEGVRDDVVDEAENVEKDVNLASVFHEFFFSFFIYYLSFTRLYLG